MEGVFQMIQIGAALSGFALYAFFTWLPLWNMGRAVSADSLFKYFVVVLMLMFGVFMVSGGRSSFSLVRFLPALAAGGIVSYGYGMGNWTIVGVGLLGVGICYIFFGE